MTRTMKIELERREAWPAGREPTALGVLARMEIAKHIRDSRQSSKLTGFEYAKRRGTRNMMDPARFWTGRENSDLRFLRVNG